MPTDPCAIPLQTIDPNCLAFKKRGGTNKRLFVGNISDIQTVMFNADGAITSIAMKTGKMLYAYNGQSFNNAGNFGFNRFDNGAVDWNHSLLFVASHISQSDLNAIKAAAEADNLFGIAQTNNGELLVYGLNSDNEGANWPFSTGLRVNSLETGTGTASGDASTVPLLMEGTADAPPIYFAGATASTLQDNILVLQGLLTAAA